MDQLTEFITNNLILFAALLGILIMLIKAELDHQANRGLFVAPTAAIRMMNNEDDTLIIDTRTAADFDKGHIKGAKNISFADLKADLDKYSDYKNKAVLIYCNSGSTATRVVRLLKTAGFQKVNNLEGGLAAWKEANMPLSKK
ncbi:MAG: sulfurtransferase [Thiotrichaceae bacterium]|nr:MAG: sulfurtransferase [Thiotrichaceae bacterium]